MIMFLASSVLESAAFHRYGLSLEPASNGKDCINCGEGGLPADDGGRGGTEGTEDGLG